LFNWLIIISGMSLLGLIKRWGKLKICIVNPGAMGCRVKAKILCYNISPGSSF
jgi:hypothetical protein